MFADLTVFEWLNGLAEEFGSLHHVLRLTASDYLIPVLAVSSLVWLWLSGHDNSERQVFQRSALGGISALGLASLIASVMAMMITRPRPFATVLHAQLLFYEPIDYSFPAHSAMVIVALGVAVRRGHAILGNMIAGGGVLMGLARISVGVNWPTDVLVAVVLGALIGASADRLLPVLDPILTWVSKALLGMPIENSNRQDNRRDDGIPAT